MVIISSIKNVLQSASLADLPNLTKRNMAKEMLIYHVLEWLYNNSRYHKLKFYGGTCARVVYDLNRLSEDIDLDNSAGVDLNNFAFDLLNHLRVNLLLPGAEVKDFVDLTNDKNKVLRFLIKLPILYELGLSKNPSDKLHIKIEISQHQQLSTAILTPVVKNGYSILINHWDESSLMSGKILACLNRSFRRGQTGIQYKGRDYYDLLWYMSRGAQPNKIKVVQESDYSNMREVWKELRQRVVLIKPADIAQDLENLFMEQNFIKAWSKQMHDLFERYLVSYYPQSSLFKKPAS